MTTTSLHITGSQATRLIRAARVGDVVTAVPAAEHRLSILDRSLRSVHDLGVDKLVAYLGICDSSPLEVLVPNDSSRRWDASATSGIKTRLLSSELPDGAFLELRQGNNKASSIHIPHDVRVFVASPALAFVQGAFALERAVKAGKMSQLAAFLRLLAFADECCGSYALNPLEPQAGKTHYDAPGQSSRFISPKQLCRFVREAGNLGGLPLARKVAPYVIDGSGSPMETYINHAFALPPRLAGLSLPPAEANKQLRVDEHDKRLLRHASLRPDLQWATYRMLAEYLGENEHASKPARIEDKNRMQDYAKTSYAAFPLMYDDVRNQDALNRTAEMLAREFMRKGLKGELYRVRRLIKNEDFRARQRILIGTLLPPLARYD